MKIPQIDGVIIRPLDLERDAEALARMWNESDLAWPGSWTDGVAVTPEAVREWELERKSLVAYVAELDGRLVGYCGLMRGHHSAKDEGYVYLLNVHPEYHGRGIGRRLMQKSTERCVQEGWKRQTLGTWSANFRAVPLYKRTGHFWTPDTSVWMQSFIPGALQMPLAKPFFERHDWYQCLVRKVTQEWDDEWWEGLKVFTQRWEADGESLTIWIDREAREPVAVETSDLFVAAIPSEIEPLAGSKVAINWRFANKGSQPLEVYLHALGDKGLKIDHVARLRLAAGETAEHSAEVKVEEDAEPSKADGSAPAVRSVLSLGEGDLELFSGMRPRKPLRLDLFPSQITLRPGQEEQVHIQLHSEMAKEARVRLQVSPMEGLKSDWQAREIVMPPTGHGAVPMGLQAEKEGVYGLAVRAEPSGEGVGKPLEEMARVFCLGPGAMLADRRGGSLRVENGAIRLTVEGKEATVKVERKVDQAALLSFRPSVGYPFYPSDFEGQEFSLDSGQKGFRSTALLSAEDPELPGLWVHERVELSTTGVGSVTLWLENRGGNVYEKRLRLGLNIPHREGLNIAMPLREGIVHVPHGEFPNGGEDAPRQPEAYAEPWIAWERDGAVVGISWSELTTRIACGYGLSLDSDLLSLGPGQSSKPISYAFYAAEGDWADARRALGWGIISARDIALPERRVLRAWFEPKTMVTTEDMVQARLIVDSTTRLPEAPQVRLTGEGVLVEPTALDVERVARGEPFIRDLSLSLPSGQPGVFRVKAQLRGMLYEDKSEFTIVRPGTGGLISISRGQQDAHEVWQVNNGARSFVVAPGFGPSVIFWGANGDNDLYSPFPQPIGFAWTYPWFGGIYPLLLPHNSKVWEGYLFRESVSAEPTEVTDEHGVKWSGVRLRCDPQKKDLRGVRVEIDFMTVAHSPIIKLVYRAQNRRPTVERLRTGFRVAARLGAEPRALTGLAEGVTRQPTNWSSEIAGQPWAALSNSATARTLLLLGRHKDVALEDCGQYGRILSSSHELQLAGDEICEQVYYLVLGDSPAQAKGYLALRDV